MRRVARAAALLLALATGRAGAATPTGTWHGDGNGHFADATPPTQWGPGRGLAWKVALPAWGNASPVVFGSLVCVTSEPTTLLCFDAKTGKKRWSATNEYVETLAPAARAEARRTLAGLAKLERTYKAKREQAYRLKRKLRRTGGTPAEVRRLETLEQEANRLRDALAATDRLRPPPPVEFIGHASATPVTDGSTLYAVFANGVVAAYDVSGRRRWITWVDEPAQVVDGLPRRHAASPLLVDGTLVVPLGHLRGLDPATGRVRWTSGPYTNFGSPVRLSVSGTEYVVTAVGDVVRVSDGRVVTSGAGGVYYAGPVAADGRAIFVGQRELRDKTRETSTATAIAYVAEGDGLRAAEAWRTPLSVAHHYNTPALADGRLYAVAVTGEFTVHSMADGRRLHHAFLEDAGRPEGAAARRGADTIGSFYASVTVAGGHVFLPAEDGTVFVYTTGDAPTFVGRSSIGETLHASPVFDGNRLYLRGFGHLFAIGPR